MKKVIALVLVVAALVLCFAGCGQKTNTPAGTTTATKLVVGVAAEPTTLDPGANGFSGANEPVQSALFCNLVDWDSDAQTVIPALAESWEWLNENTCRFYLNKNAVSQKGTPITAHDVKWCYERIYNNPAIANSISNFDMSKTTVVDDYTVDLYLPRCNYNALSALTLYVCSIVSQKDFEEIGEEAFARNPVATGPYTLGEWKTGESIVINKVASYWGGESYYDSIVFKPIPDTNARILALQSGDIDFAEALGSASIPTLQGDSNIEVIETNVNQTQTLWFNCDDGPLADQRVRYALEYAIDKEAVGKTVFMGYGHAADSIFNSESDQYRAPKDPRTYNPEKAKELLAEAGYADGFTINLACYESTDFANLLQSVAYYWEQIGVIANIQVMEKGSFFGLIYSDDFDIYCIHQVGTDPMVRVASLSRDIPRSGGNQTKLWNERVDELRVLINAEQDSAKANEMYKEMADILYEECHFIHIWESKYISGAKPGITNIKADSISNFQYDMFKGA